MATNCPKLEFLICY